MYADAPLWSLARRPIASGVEKHPDDVVTFHRRPQYQTTRTSASPTADSAPSTVARNTRGYNRFSYEQIGQKIEETKALGGVQS